jgi:hypothetical protein
MTGFYFLKWNDLKLNNAYPYELLTFGKSDVGKLVKQGGDNK